MATNDDIREEFALNDMQDIQAAIEAATAELSLPITPSTDSDADALVNNNVNGNDSNSNNSSNNNNSIGIFPYPNESILTSQQNYMQPNVQQINELKSIKKTIESVVLPPIISGKQTNTNKLLLKKPKKMTRAKHWTKEVENLFRYQSAGFRDYNEYIEVYEEPEHWIDEVNENFNGLVRCLRTKQSGLYMYFRATRECEDKHLNKIKLYEY